MFHVRKPGNSASGLAYLFVIIWLWEKRSWYWRIILRAPGKPNKGSLIDSKRPLLDTELNPRFRVLGNVVMVEENDRPYILILQVELPALVNLALPRDKTDHVLAPGKVQPRGLKSVAHTMGKDVFDHQFSVDLHLEVHAFHHRTLVGDVECEPASGIDKLTLAGRWARSIAAG